MFLVLALSAFNIPIAAEEVAKLKVCADPFMLPFSNNEEQGYENKIAELFAEKMGVELEYVWFPQRIGFIRNTLKKEEPAGSGKYACDLVITVPSSFELAATTKPYYTTSYVLVYKKGRGLDGLTDPQKFSEYTNEHKPHIKFGVTDRGPAQLWAFYQGMMSSDHMIPYQGQPGDAKTHPGKRMMDDIVSEKIDAAVIWGPTAGYYAKQYKGDSEFVLLPLPDDKRNREMKYTYSMSMAVRYGEKEWKEKINQLIDENRKEIRQILEDFGVPLTDSK